MTDHDLAKVAKHIADLRLQVNALEVTTKNETLPASMQETRSTMRWSAFVIALALIVSSALKLYSDKRVEALEKRVQALEKYHTVPVSP